MGKEVWRCRIHDECDDGEWEQRKRWRPSSCRGSRFFSTKSNPYLCDERQLQQLRSRTLGDSRRMRCAASNSLSREAMCQVQTFVASNWIGRRRYSTGADCKCEVLKLSWGRISHNEGEVIQWLEGFKWCSVLATFNPSEWCRSARKCRDKE